MTSRIASLFLVGNCVLFALLTWGQEAKSPPSRYALLIGIDQYEHSAADIKLPNGGVPREGRYAPALTYPDLAGPANDVKAMEQVLTTKFHFPDDEGHLKVLLDAKATRDAILKAIQQYIVDLPQKGDIAVLYVSSHGSLRIYAKNQGEGMLFDPNGDPTDERHAENTLVPYDWYTGVDDIFSRDLRHFYREAVAKGIHVTAIFDSCHSGDLGRGLISGKVVPREFDFDPREMPPNPYAKEERSTLPQNDPVTPVLILSAAQKDQLAIDDETQDPAHGLFSSALVETLNSLPADRPASDVFSRLQVSMELAPNSTHQQPELDTPPERRRQPIFGGQATAGPTTAAVVNVGLDGVLLDIGIVADIGPGSIFTSLAGTGSNAVKLMVIKSVGLGRSIAQIQKPGGAVHASDIVQLEAAVPWQRPDLLVYAGQTNPSLAELQDAITSVKSAPLHFPADPSRDAWTHHLYWDTTHWVLYTHSLGERTKENKDPIIDLGTKLTVKALKHLSPSSVVWFDPPLPRESIPALLPPPSGDSLGIAAKLTPDRSSATYVIGANMDGDTISYAWFKRSDMDAEVQTPKWMGPGCSPGSSYPLRTEWIDEPSPELTVAALNKYAANLAKLNGWFLLQSSPLSEHQQFPYVLALRPADGGPNVGPNGTTFANSSEQSAEGKYFLDLIGNPSHFVVPEWVYVLNIDCQGNGNVVWPYEGDPNNPNEISQPPKMFPIDNGNQGPPEPEITLPGDPFPVGPPLGTDTYILLTTSTPLRNYQALSFDRVVSRAVVDNPLEELLEDTSSGTRWAGEPIPTNWGVWAMQVESKPALDSASQ